MADAVVDPAAPEAGTGETPGAGEGQAPETQAHPILQDRFGGDVTKLAEAYANADAFIGKQGSEMGRKIKELESQLQAAQQALTPPQQGDLGSQGVPELSVDQWQEWYDQDPLQAQAYLLAKNNEALLSQIDDRLNERLSPIAKEQGREVANRIAYGLRDSLGDEVFDRNFETIAKALQEEPDLRDGDAETVFKRLRRVVIEAEWERGTTPPQNGSQPGPRPVNIGGGSSGRSLAADGGQELSEAEQIRADMNALGTARDRFGNPVRS